MHSDDYAETMDQNDDYFINDFDNKEFKSKTFKTKLADMLFRKIFGHTLIKLAEN